MNYTSFHTIIIFCTLFFCTNLSIGQEKKNSSLIERIRAYEKLETNEERDAHLQEVSDLLNNRPKNYLEQLLNNHNFKPSSQQLLLIDFAKAENARKTGDYETSDFAYEKLIEQLKITEPIDNTFLAIAYMRYSYAQSFTNIDYVEGLKKHRLGLEYAIKSGVKKTIMYYHSILSFYYGRLDDGKKKILHNRHAYTIATSLSDTTKFVMANATYINFMYVDGQTESALKIWNEMRPYIHKVEFENAGKSILFGHVAKAYLISSQLDSAKYYVNTIIKMDSLAGRSFLQPSNANLKAEILLNEGKFKESLSLYQIANTMAKEKKYHISQMISALGATIILSKEERYSEAEIMLREAYINNAFYRAYNRAEIEEALSEVFEKQNKLDSALFYRKKADLSFKEYNQQKADKHLALAKVELEIDEFIQENQNLTVSNNDLNQKVSKSKKTSNILLYSFITVIVLIGLFLYHKNQKEKLRVIEYREQLTNKERIAIEAELNTIRSQMNPHFMFNSLNSINEFIQNDSGEDASNYLVKFSRLMRSTLNYSKRKFVTLEEEIDLLKLYIELENLRFYNSIDFSLTIDPSVNIKKVLIPPMMIQPFVENAIWHGLMAKAEDRKLSLSFSENDHNVICEIEDNGIGRAASAKQKASNSKHKSQGIGLTQRRLELLKSIHGKDAGIDVIDLEIEGQTAGTMVKVILPKKITE